jgi:uncharacterized protein YbjT (DUF2867 family)
MILVVGATGSLGSAVIQSLLARGEQVRGLARSPEKADNLLLAGAEIVRGDLIDPASLEEACRGVQHVFTAVHSMLGRGKYESRFVDGSGHRSLIDAAKSAGTAQLVYTSIVGASADHPVDFFRTKHGIEEYLKSSGLSYTILRPTGFMEDHAHEFNGKAILEKGKTALLGNGTKPRNFIAVRDAAECAVRALTDPGLATRTIEIGGPGNYTNRQVAQLYGELSGITPKISAMPPWAARLMSILLKPIQPGISRLMYLSSLPDGAFRETIDLAEMLEVFPINLTTLHEFILERITERELAAAAA